MLIFLWSNFYKSLITLISSLVLCNLISYNCLITKLNPLPHYHWIQLLVRENQVIPCDDDPFSLVYKLVRVWKTIFESGLDKLGSMCPDIFFPLSKNNVLWNDEYIKYSVIPLLGSSYVITCKHELNDCKICCWFLFFFQMAIKCLLFVMESDWFSRVIWVVESILVKWLVIKL